MFERPPQFKHCLQDVVEALKIPWSLIGSYLGANRNLFFQEGWQEGDGIMHMWITDRAYNMIKAYFDGLPILSEVEVPVPDAMLNTIILEAQINRALTTGNKAEFMRLTSVYKDQK